MVFLRLPEPSDLVRVQLVGLLPWLIGERRSVSFLPSWQNIWQIWGFTPKYSPSSLKSFVLLQAVAGWRQIYKKLCKRTDRRQKTTTVTAAAIGTDLESSGLALVSASVGSWLPPPIQFDWQGPDSKSVLTHVKFMLVSHGHVYKNAYAFSKISLFTPDCFWKKISA